MNFGVVRPCLCGDLVEQRPECRFELDAGRVPADADRPVDLPVALRILAGKYPAHRLNPPVFCWSWAPDGRCCRRFARQFRPKSRSVQSNFRPSAGSAFCEAVVTGCHHLCRPWRIIGHEMRDRRRLHLAKAIHIDDPGSRRGPLDRLLQRRIRPRNRRPAGFRHVHARLSQQSRSRFRGRTDDQQGQGTEPYALGDGYGHHRLLRRRSRRRACPLRARRASIHERSSSSIATARCSPASSLSRIPTATRSRCCSGTADIDRACAGASTATPASQSRLAGATSKQGRKTWSRSTKRSPGSRGASS